MACLPHYEGDFGMSAARLAGQSNTHRTKKPVDLNFRDSIWCNVAVAFQRVDMLYKQEVQSLGLAVIEWYILRTLYDHDGLMAGQLARAVGRTPTSFTSTIDTVERKRLVQRSIQPSNRRSVRIYLTEQGKALEGQVIASANRIDGKIRQQFTDEEWQVYERVIENLQILNPAQIICSD
jgi:DNA-binding MarR family transcriptional regulator